MTYVIPCDSQFTFGVVVGGQTFYVDESNLIVSLGNDKCVSSIEAWTDSWQTQYVFGSRFLCTVYLYVLDRTPGIRPLLTIVGRIFNVPRNGTQQIGFSPRADWSEKAPLDVKAVVGGTVGGAALIVFAVLGGLYLRRQWKTSEPRGGVPVLPSASEYEEAAKTPQSGWHIQPFMMMSPAPRHPKEQSPPQSAASTSYPMSPTSPGRSPSPPLSPIIFIDDNRSIDAAPPSYRAHDSYLRNLPLSSPGPIQVSQSMGGVSFGTTQATCGGKGA